MALRIVEEAALTDVGRQRHANEDSYYGSAPIFAVADGMGGARAGEVASRIAVEAFQEARDEGAAPEDQLAEIARAANRRIFELAQRDETHAGMGTTLTALMVAGNDVAIGHVGDSRAYRFRDDELERLTQDHSLVEELVRQGKLTSEQAEVHPQRSIITRALGPEPDVDVETLSYPARDGDVYLVCSDGLTGMVSEPRLAQLLRARSSLAQAAEALVAEANERGGRDNITVLLFRLGDDDERDADSDTLTGRQPAVGGGDTAVHAAVTAEPGSAGDSDRARAGPEPSGETLVMTAAEAEAARRATEPREPSPLTAAARPPQSPRSVPPRRRHRRLLTALVTAAVVAAVLVGLWAGSRQFWFVGTDNDGLIALYRGLPYQLPLGIKLYTQEYRSGVPAGSLQSLQRKRVLDHQLRGRSDAADLVRSLERAYAS